MKIKAFILTALTLLFSFLMPAMADNNNSPLGYWKSVDDQSGEALSIIQIYTVDDGSLEAKIVKIMAVLGQKPSDRCVKCKNELSNKPLQGLRIVWGMKPVSPEIWGHGHVLDLKNGNTYKGTMTLLNNGQTLRLRGYEGVPIIGQAEIWQRAQKP